MPAICKPIKLKTAFRFSLRSFLKCRTTPGNENSTDSNSKGYTEVSGRQQINSFIADNINPRPGMSGNGIRNKKTERKSSNQWAGGSLNPLSSITPQCCKSSSQALHAFCQLHRRGCLPRLSPSNNQKSRKQFFLLEVSWKAVAFSTNHLSVPGI